MPRNLKKVRRQMQVSEAWRNIAREVEAIMATRNCTKEKALATVFADPELLAKCHLVTPQSRIQVPALESPTMAQRDSGEGECRK